MIFGIWSIIPLETILWMVVLILSLKQKFCRVDELTWFWLLEAGVQEWGGHVLTPFPICEGVGICKRNIFSNHLPHCRRFLYQLSHKWSPRILEWVAYPFSSGSSQLRNQTGVSCIAGRVFTNWAIREAHWYPLSCQGSGAWERLNAPSRSGKRKRVTKRMKGCMTSNWLTEKHALASIQLFETP